MTYDVFYFENNTAPTIQVLFVCYLGDKNSNFKTSLQNFYWLVVASLHVILTRFTIFK